MELYIILLIVISYLFISLIVNRILVKFTKLYPSDITFITIFWLIALPIIFTYSAITRGVDHIIKGIDKYLDRFGTKKWT